MNTTKVTAVLLATTALAAPAFAQVPVPPATQTAAAAVSGLGSRSEEIVVTAQKRSERIQKVPINITAISAKGLTQAGITSLQDIQRVAPTFHYATAIGSLGARLSIRGVGSFSNSAIEPSVADFIDGIYIPRPASIVSSLLDIQQIEVLSGPQGTLFGRNASAGAVTYRSAPPTNVFSDDAKFDYSTGNHYRIEDALNVPINDQLSVRVAGLADLFQGYWKSELNDKPFGGLDTYQGRISVKYTPTNDITWIVRADDSHSHGDNAQNAKLIPGSLTPTTIASLTAKQGGIAPDLDLYNNKNEFYDGHFFDRDNIALFSSDLSWHTGSGYTLRLLDGYNDWLSNQGDGDTAYLAAYTLGRNLYYHSQSQSHELQFISPPDLMGGRLSFVGGLYYYHEHLTIIADSLNGPNFCNVFGPILSPTLRAACPAYEGVDAAKSSEGNFVQQTDSEAAYTQATYKITPRLSLTGGVRFTDEEKYATYVGRNYNFTGTFFAANEHTDLSLRNNKFTYRGNVSYALSDDVLLFATYSTGFKSGGFNNGVATAVLGQTRIFQPETIQNYEIGVKSQFLHDRLTLNATAFDDQISNFQERGIVNTTATVSNVGKVRQEGVEFQGQEKLFPWLSLNQSIDYLDSDIIQDCKAAIPAYISASPTNPFATSLARCAGQPLSTQSLAGAPLTFNPRWSGVVGGQIDGGLPRYDLHWTLNSDVDFFSNQNINLVLDNSPLTVQPGYALINARFTVYGPDNRWSVGVYGRNLANRGYCSAEGYQTLFSLLGTKVASPPNVARVCLVGAPLVVGVTATVHF